MSFTAQSVTILQVSDLESALVFKKPLAMLAAEWTTTARWSAAVELLKHSLAETNALRIDLLVLNGDCIKGGRGVKETPELKRKKFIEFADHFVVPLATYLLERFHTKFIIIVPGNHDVVRDSGDGAASINHVNERLRSFFAMVDQVTLALNGKMIVQAAPKSATDPIKSVTTDDGGFEFFPLNSALLSGANIDMITEVLSGKGKKALDESEYEHIYAESDKINEAIDKADGVDKALKEKLSSDAALVPQQHLGQLASAYRKPTSGAYQPCRIAIVHHNSVPYPHETSGRVKSYGFCNSGAFHAKLSEGGFRFVLHGHQHESRVFELADLSHPHPIESVEPRRLLFIGAACFGSDETPEGQMGFNVIQFSKPVHDACVAEISHFGFDTTKRDGVDPGSLSVRRITHVSTVPPLVNGRHKVAESLFQNCLQTNYLERYERCLRLEDPTAESFYGEFRQTRDVFQSIYAIYSVSVFEPRLWGEQRFAEFFLPEARHNLARAAAVAKSLEAELALTAGLSSAGGVDDLCKYFKKLIHGSFPGLHFRFSHPVFSGVQQANRNAEKLKIGSRFSNTNGNVNESFVRGLLRNRPRDVKNREYNFFARTLKGPRHALSQQPRNMHDSLSVWDNATTISNLKLDDPEVPNVPNSEMQEVAEKLLSRPFYEGIYLSVSAISGFHPLKPQDSKHEGEYMQLQEFPRIVLWTREQFFQPQAIECIEFHEHSGFPLFWINPERLNGRSGVKRKKYGHYSILGCARGEPVVHKDNVNDELGHKATKEDIVGDDEDIAGVTEAIWGRLNMPKGLMPHADPINEFMHLVQRRDIMFAADVWAILRLGETAWLDMEKFLNDQENARA
jgi:hypothetical protein